MEENPCILYRPLAFYPFSSSSGAQTGMNIWTLESGNEDMTYNFPVYNTAVASGFPLLKQYHVFEQPKSEDAPQRNDFVPYFSRYNYDAKQINSPSNAIRLFSTTQHESRRSCTSELNLVTMNSGEDSNDFKIPDTLNREKSSKIWRPFSPELDCDSTPNKSVNSDILEKQKNTIHEASHCRIFPTILPSTVTLEESSVFKAVKKKKYQCRHCDQWYLNSGQLAGHIRVHIGSKTYRCEYHGCLRAFARNEELTRHRRIHSGVKPHQCETCQKRFGRKDHLNKHKKTHMKASEKKIYLCGVPGCKHRYTRSDALTRHLSSAHSVKHQKSNIGKNRQNLLLVPNINNSLSMKNYSG